MSAHAFAFLGARSRRVYALRAIAAAALTQVMLRCAGLF
jgi:hypothetical protein